MYLRNNPVLQRELLLNLRQVRSFALLGLFVAVLGIVVALAWPEARQLDMTRSQEGKTLCHLFLLIQYLFASLLVPSFAAGAIAGEKERQSYEMLLASPLTPGAIVIGKWLASLGLIGLLIVASLPIVMLCLPLGGVSFYELLGLYVALGSALGAWAAIGLACSTIFARTASSLVVSYSLILPASLLGILLWFILGSVGSEARLILLTMGAPLAAAFACLVLLQYSARRLLQPDDIGSEGRTVVDEVAEQEEAVGLTLSRADFPDRLIVPPKRDDLLADGVNPVLEKELCSELFSQGSLMMRLVIQLSMLVALPMMAFYLFLQPEKCTHYFVYVMLFNMMAGPVFLAGGITSERERETIDLLRVTLLRPSQIFWGKLLAGLRISLMLTALLLWPVILACLLNTFYWSNWRLVLGCLSLLIVAGTTAGIVALACSIWSEKTSRSMLTAYVVLAILFFGPVAAQAFFATFSPSSAGDAQAFLAPLSPLGAVLTLPLEGHWNAKPSAEAWKDWTAWRRCLIGYLAFDALLLSVAYQGLKRRWG